MAGLKIQNLVKSFGSKQVLEGISFEVADGEFCILVGPSGCGKSTALRLIAGLDRQDGGKIFIGDSEVSERTPRERDIAMVFQNYALYPQMSVYENMAFPLKMRRSPRWEIEAQVREAARFLEIEELLARKPKQLSGGQRQRVAIGRAIVRKPQLFLFDEPLSNLDAKLRNAMRIELAGLHRKLGSTMLYVTHDQTEAMTLGQKIILLNEGKIQQIGTPEDVYERPANLFVAGFIGSPQMNFLRGTIASEGGKHFFRSGNLSFEVQDKEKLRLYGGREVTMGIRPEALIPGGGPLKGQIEFVERLGAETIIYVKAGDMTLVIRVPADFPKKVGEEAAFSLQARGAHFFPAGNPNY